MATFLSLSSVKSEEEEVQEERVAPTTWRDIPAEFKATMLCSDCALPAYDVENPVVLTCAHILCMKCLTQKWNSLTLAAKAEEEIECPRCATKVSIPKGGIQGFPVDTFTRTLRNSILQTEIQFGATALPRCGLHPEERLSNYCQRCQTQVCKLCMNGNHTGHELESLEITAQRLDSELMDCIRPYLDCTAAQISDTLQTLEEEREKMKRDIQQVLKDHKTIKDTAQHKVTQCQEKVQKITRSLEQAVQNLETAQKSLENQELFAEALQTVKPMVDSVKSGQEKIMGCLNAACQDQQTIAKKAQRNIEKLENILQDAMAKFTGAAEKLSAMKISVDANQSFAEILHTKSNDSDKVSRIPGMKDKMLHRKLYSGKQIELETLVWEFDKCQAEGKLFNAIKLRETLVESLGGNEGSLFQGLQHVGTIPVPCKPAWRVTPVQMFAHHYILHACSGIDADKICVHDTTGAITQLISVPGAKYCASSVVVDSTRGLMVVSDEMTVLTDEMHEGKSKTHLSGALRWLTLSKAFDVTDHKVISLRCVPDGFMNVNKEGHLLVLTLCTTGKHPKELHVYGNHQRALYQVNLPSEMERPLSPMSSASDMFVIVGKHGVWWIDHQGQMLQQYGQEPRELPLAVHCDITQHSKGGPLLVTDWKQDRVVLLSNEATLLQHLPDVEYPTTLYLDEKAALLFVTRWADKNNVKVTVFQLRLKITRKIGLQDQG